MYSVLLQMLHFYVKCNFVNFSFIWFLLTKSISNCYFFPHQVYTFCVTFLQGGQVMPGCTGPVLPSRASESQMPRVSISSLHGNVSLTHNMTVHVAARVPSSMLSSSHIEVGLFGSESSSISSCSLTPNRIKFVFSLTFFSHKLA